MDLSTYRHRCHNQRSLTRTESLLRRISHFSKVFLTPEITPYGMSSGMNKNIEPTSSTFISLLRIHVHTLPLPLRREWGEDWRTDERRVVSGEDPRRIRSVSTRGPEPVGGRDLVREPLFWSTSLLRSSGTGEDKWKGKGRTYKDGGRTHLCLTVRETLTDVWEQGQVETGRGQYT